MPISKQKNAVLTKIRSRLDSWVMLSDTSGFVPLPSEKIVYTSPPRTTLAIETPRAYPGNNPVSLHSGAGCVYLTNQRASRHALGLIVYLPATSTPSLQSFSAPLLNLHDSHVSAPFFGPNVWSALLQPVPGGGIPPTQAAIEVKMVFKDGGAFDFHSNFERIKERLQQAVENARESGALSGDDPTTGSSRGGGPLSNVDLSTIDLEQLPAYEAPPGGRPAPGPQGIAAQSTATQRAVDDVPSAPSQYQGSQPPNEPPPGYEETQRQSIADELERRLSEP